MRNIREYNKGSSKKKKQKAIEASKKKLEKSLKLTHKQELFCEYYIKNFNATMAYIKAYECDYNTANVNGYKLLVNAGIKNKIQQLKEIKKQSIALNEDDIIERYMRIAFSDMTDFVEFKNEDDRNIIKLKNSNSVDGGLICQIKQGRDGTSIKLEDRQKALEWLGKYFVMNPLDKHKINFDNEKLKLEKEKINNEDSNDRTRMAIDEFLEATRPSKQDLEEIFDDE